MYRQRDSNATAACYDRIKQNVLQQYLGATFLEKKISDGEVGLECRGRQVVGGKKMAKMVGRKRCATKGKCE